LAIVTVCTTGLGAGLSLGLPSLLSVPEDDAAAGVEAEEAGAGAEELPLDEAAPPDEPVSADGLSTPAELPPLAAPAPLADVLLAALPLACEPPLPEGLLASATGGAGATGSGELGIGLGAIAWTTLGVGAGAVLWAALLAAAAAASAVAFAAASAAACAAACAAA